MSHTIRRIESSPVRAVVLGLAGALVIAACSGDARAQSTNFRSTMSRFPETSGEGLYKAICQGCHMPDAQGAKGAGAYPALAGDPKLEAGGYLAAVVVRGQKAMPSFAYSLSDEQIAAVVNYVRSHFGNAYKDEVTVEDVKAARP